MIPLMLQPQSLQGLYELFASEKASELLQWFPDISATEEGQLVQYDTLKYGRDVAQINTRGGTPNPVKPPVRGTVIGHTITMSEEIQIPNNVVKDLRAPGSMKPAAATSYVATAMKQLRLRVGHRKALFAAQCLGTASGNLSFTLPGEAAVTTVSLNYLATHQAIGSAWQTHTTDILANIRAAKVLVARDGGMPATDIVMNSITAGYLGINDNILDLLNLALRATLLEGGLPATICGLVPHVVDEVYVNDETGAVTELIPDNHVAILAGDNNGRGMIETAPQSDKAPEGHRGMFFHVVEGPNINDGVTVQYETNIFPLLANPNGIVYDTTVAA